MVALINVIKHKILFTLRKYFRCHGHIPVDVLCVCDVRQASLAGLLQKTREVSRAV